jgi:hypothetical protein
MSEKIKFLGSSKVSKPGYRVSIVKDAADILEIQEGDHVLYYQDEKGQILIRKG